MWGKGLDAEVDLEIGFRFCFGIFLLGLLKSAGF